MNKIKVHQFSPSASKGDGITNGMFYLQKILISLGFESIIYAQNIREGLENLVFHYDTIDKKDINQIIFIHYSIYYDFSVWIDKLNIKKHIIRIDQSFFGRVICPDTTNFRNCKSFSKPGGNMYPSLY